MDEDYGLESRPVPDSNYDNWDTLCTSYAHKLSNVLMTSIPLRVYVHSDPHTQGLRLQKGTEAIAQSRRPLQSICFWRDVAVRSVERINQHFASTEPFSSKSLNQLSPIVGLGRASDCYGLFTTAEATKRILVCFATVI
ncbi:hypothetical protein K0M31_017918 [Melipona bicolor]|uniref:Uncharacterized protein n=1 Tax=Melipona bicolor TaxID=60889 RepID=A0AA40G6K8_9HYME|nr:hypothetical protein K0M31_017918 [Melipona bicolor]